MLMETLVFWSQNSAAAFPYTTEADGKGSREAQRSQIDFAKTLFTHFFKAKNLPCRHQAKSISALVGAKAHIKGLFLYKSIWDLRVS